MLEGNRTPTFPRARGRSLGSPGECVSGRRRPADRGTKAVVLRTTLLLSTILIAGLVTPAARPSIGYARLLASPAACPHSDDPTADTSEQRDAMACLVNWARHRSGLRSLRRSRVLDRAATLKLADDSRCGQFSHTACGKPFLTVFRLSGYLEPGQAYRVGENLAWAATGADASPRGIFADWLSSPEHRANVLSPSWTEMGFALRVGSFEGRSAVILWASEFGSHT